MFDWFRRRRRKRLLRAPFPKTWPGYLTRNMAHYSHLRAEERDRLHRLVQVFVAEKHWEGLGGFELTDEVRVTIAGQACLLILGLEHVFFRNVETILVYPSTVIPKRAEEAMFARPTVVRPILPILGEAHSRGPVILTWDAVRRGGVHPELGYNVVYHEFAHKLDMLDGAIDGTPPIADKRQYARWVEVCQRAYDRLLEASHRGESTFLDPYAGTNVGEFFAVATEFFFDRPLTMQSELPDLYEVFRDFYRQDPAEREERR